MWAGMYDEMLEDMLVRQKQYLPPVEFLRNTAIPQYIHQRLADWMLETCEDFRCDSDVFAAAITIMDRFIAVKASTVRVEHLAVIGFASIFLAVKQSGKIIRATTLCNFLGNGFTEAELKAKELEILTALDWRLDTVKPHDFLDQFLQRLPFHTRPEELETLKVRAEVFIDMCYCEASFVHYGPAVIAAAALYNAIVGIEGAQGTSPMYNQIPMGFLNSCFGLNKFFRGQDEVTKLMTCVDAVKILFRAYHSDPLANGAGNGPIRELKLIRG